MIEVPIYSLGNPGTFDITDKTDPMYYVARYNHEMSKNLYDMNVAGFEWRQTEDSDISSIISDFDTYSGNLVTWFESAVEASNDDLPIPAPPTVPALPGSPLPGIIISIIARIIVKILVDWLGRKLDPNTEAKEIAQILKKAFIGEIDSNEFPLMSQLANTPLEIIISKYGAYDHFLYADREVE